MEDAKRSGRPRGAGVPPGEPESSAMDGVTEPMGYLVLDSPNRGENGSYACPHQGCDGLTFDTAVECIIHETEWHSPPYECRECKKRFAAQTALNRHATATGHEQIWTCREPRCPENETEFQSNLALLCHVIGSKTHQRIREARYFTRAQAKPVYKEIPWDDDSTADEASKETVKDEYKCEEPYCCKYEHDFRSDREYEKHVKGQGHVAATALAQTLKDVEMTDEERAAKQKAARECTCDAAICPMFGRKFSSSTSYHHHIKTVAHLEGPPQQKAKPHNEGISYQKPKPVRVPSDKQCMAPRCIKFLHVFSSNKCYLKHLNSEMHTHAVQSETERFATPGLGEEMLTTFGGLVSPVTPTFFKAPGTAARRLVTTYDSDEDESEDQNEDAEVKTRLGELEKANVELKRKVLELEAEVDKLKAATTEAKPTTAVEVEEKAIEPITIDD